MESLNIRGKSFFFIKKEKKTALKLYSNLQGKLNVMEKKKKETKFDKTLINHRFHSHYAHACKFVRKERRRILY